MRSPKAIFGACLAAVLTASTVAAAGALITGQSGSVIKLATPPASVKLNALENGTSVHAFDEAQKKTLSSAIAVDGVNPGTYTSFPSGSAKVAAGTVVDSHLIHSDVPSKNFTTRRQGSVTFADDILGVIASTAKLASSDSLGATGTQYAGSTQWRGLESGEGGSSSLSDRFTISADRRTITFDLQTLVMDEIRVLTKHKNQLVTTVSGSPSPVQAGSNVTYTVTVKNTGSSTATGVQVANTFPGATLVSATSSGGCSGTTTVTCNLGSIAAGGSAVATIVVKSASSPGTITFTATSPPGQAPAGTATTSVVSPSLTTTISDSPDPVTAGNDVQYTLTVTNNGTAPVANVHVIDTLPPGTSLVTTSSPGGCTGTTTVDCTLGLLNVGASAVARIVVTSPGSVPSGGTITNTAVASPGSNTAANETTTVEAPEDGVAKGFVIPGGSITIPGDDPATLSLPNTGSGAPVIITQGDGTFCNGPCTGTTTTISDFPGYSDPANPIHLSLVYNFPSSPTSLTDAATAFGSTIYKNVDPENPNSGFALGSCATPGVASPNGCVDGKTIVQTSPNVFQVVFEIIYLSGDPKFGRR